MLRTCPPPVAVPVEYLLVTCFRYLLSSRCCPSGDSCEPEQKRRSRRSEPPVAVGPEGVEDSQRGAEKVQATCRVRGSPGGQATAAACEKRAYEEGHRSIVKGRSVQFEVVDGIGPGVPGNAQDYPRTAGWQLGAVRSQEFDSVARG